MKKNMLSARKWHLGAMVLLMLAFQLSAQSWTTTCDSGVLVEIMAKGMGTRNEVINPVQINIPNPETVDSILVQVVLKVPDGTPAPDHIVVNTTSQSINLTVPNIIVEGKGNHYETVLHGSSFVKAQVFGTGNSQYQSPRALVVYIFRHGFFGRYHTGEFVHKGIWWDATDRPHSYSRIYSVPATMGAKTIAATFAVTDKDSDTGRDVILRAQAGTISQQQTFLTSSEGEEMLLKTLTLENVPGDVTTVTVTVTSPDDRGDSIYWSGVDISTACEMDFGDAPEPCFPTLLASDGARHLYRPGYFLGAAIDTESDGHPDLEANGNDLDGIDDEDGVEFLTEFLYGHEASILVTASAPGYLNAWIDFNSDCVWGEIEEHPIQDRWIGAGSHTFSFVVPHSLLPSYSTVARFRFSSQRGLTPTGLAIDGEVEDYLVHVYEPVELTSFQASAISNQVVLQWQTASESENLGFNIYRSEREDGVFSRINAELIQGAGNSASKQSYQYVDKNVSAGNVYYYQLVDVSVRGIEQWHGPVVVELIKPTQDQLEQNAPNPFNAHTRISYSIKKGGDVSLAIYNLQGQLVRTLVEARQQAGSYSVIWDGKNFDGRDVPSGTYLYTMQTPDGELSHRMTLVK